MGGKSPDYRDIAVAQGDANKEVVRDQTYANRPNQYSPWGYTSWNPESTKDPVTGEDVTSWNQTTGFTPELQDIFNKQIAMMGGRTDVAGGLVGRMGSEFGTPVDWGTLSPMGINPTNQLTLPEGDIGDPYQTRQAAEDSVYNQAQSRLAPRFDEQKRAAEVRMRNQGLRPEDSAWKSQMEGIGQNETDAYNQAMWSANQAGRQESGQMWGQMMGQNQNNFSQALGANAQNFGQAMQGSQYANAMRQQQMAETMQKRGFSLNEINALMNGQQVNLPSMPGFTSAQGAQAAPIYQGAMDKANSDAMAQQNYIGAGVGLAGAAMAASDRRLKRDIRRIGTVKGYPWYSFTYEWGQPSQGVMSDEIPQEFVSKASNGFDIVNYSALLES